LRAQNVTVVRTNETSSDISAVHFVPFYQLQLSRPDLHPVGHTTGFYKKKDDKSRVCTDPAHWLYTPLFFEPFIADLLRIVRSVML